MWLEWLQDFHESNIMYIFSRFILNRRCIHIMIGRSESAEDQHQVQSEDALKHALVDADA